MSEQPAFKALFLQIESIDLWQWTAPGEKKATQLHALFQIPDLDLTLVMRFKGPVSLDQLIQQLQQHRREIWSEGGQDER